MADGDDRERPEVSAGEAGAEERVPEPVIPVGATKVAGPVPESGKRFLRRLFGG